MKRPKVFVYGVSSGKNGVTDEKSLWYCIDLEALPDPDAPLSPVAEIKGEYGGDWTIMGDYIYWAGAINWVTQIASRKLRRHNITTDQPAEWDTCSYMKVLRKGPCLFALDGKIFVVGGEIHYAELYSEHIERFYGESYDLSTKTWDLLALNLQDFAPSFSCRTTALVMDDEKPKEVVLHSFFTGHLLFYDIGADSFKSQLHPNFLILPGKLPLGLVRDTDFRSIRILIQAMCSVKPVVRDSTLYWFTSDLCLYGYDYVKKRWFQSQHLKEEQLWALPSGGDSGDSLIRPLLVDLYNGEEFLLLLPTYSGELGIAILAVSKPETKEFLKVTVELCRTISPSHSDFSPRNGMAMLNSALLG